MKCTCLKMASVCSDSNIVSVSCSSKTLILRLSDGELYSFLHSDICGKSNSAETTSTSQTSSKVQSESEEIGLGLSCCDVSSNGKQLAFCTLSKILCIVDMSGHKPLIVKEYSLVRGASKVRFTPSNKHILVADKSGDVYLFQPETCSNSGQLILGHLSLLLDILLTSDEQFIVTCDRDEKIRISSYPNGYNVVAYCLGHTEFVSSLSFLPHNSKYLISTSGDGTIRFWDFKVGAEVEVFNTSQCFDLKDKMDENDETECDIPALTDAATSFVDSVTSLICVTVDNFSACLVFKCTTEDNSLHCNNIQKILLQDSHPWSISLSSKVLWVVYSSDDKLQVKIKSFNVELCKFEDNVPSNISKAVKLLNDQKLTIDQKKNLVDLLFKRKFENVQEYLSRKETRLYNQGPPNKKVKA